MTSESYRRCIERRYKKAKEAYLEWIKVYPFTLDDLDGEIWRDIEGYNDYQVSNYGRIKSFKGASITIKKPTLDGTGYLQLGLYQNGKLKMGRIHKLVAENFIPHVEGKDHINHIDGNTFNNFVSNLEWVTPSENIRHAIAMGLKPIFTGEDVSTAKLTNEQAKYIRENVEKLSLDELAKRFGVTKARISSIQLGKTFKKIGGVLREKQPAGRAKVPLEKQLEILSQYKKGVQGHGLKALAKKFGYAISTIYKITHAAHQDESNSSAPP